MRLIKIVSYVFVIALMQSWLVATPVVQKICNDTDFGFYVLHHSDDSECSLHDKSIIIQPMTIFSHEFLLARDQKGLILRPVFYKEPKTGNLYWFVDQRSYEYNPELIWKAYEVWKRRDITRKYKDDQDWFNQWVGQDITVAFDPLEILGYLLDLSRIRIKNFNHQHVQWLSFAKGVFSKLMINLHLTALPRKGVMTKVIVRHGPGGICTNGAVERL